MLEHQTPLITTIVVGLSLAFAFGLAAQRLRISPLVGYLLAGVAVGPFTPGFVADAPLANELAEIGVILLMFGVGLHFSWRTSLSVRAIAIPGAVAQIGGRDAARHGACAVARLGAGRGARLRACAVGRQHRRAAARACRSGDSWTPSAAASRSAG